ncbi:hypothetical protein ABD67_10375 [Bacillus sonorensis]|uniref:Methyl-accepting chemotaxis protein n=1 Tax=Bacillus sonorensis L12 TaxID=1274524 RepID=M5P8F6_9BACI|nr:hypothetical protein [Bacillus sp. PM8313]EME76276.1 methyl-accepting chemotaxis protein [Bacillus sonorensis L12]MBG9915309.1 hypothetical protein [Bacillus sonorensis]TWK82334.1 hypothetical protein CHCC20335_3377 [Bacillus paralicheniformis]MDI3411902.1 hypothetical protein [Bacillus sonorensis]UBF30963.1 hypothetical protein K9N56_12745 [Bacillus sp. PM8313]
MVQQVASLIQEAAASTDTSGVEAIQHTVHTLAAGTKEMPANTEAGCKIITATARFNGGNLLSLPSRFHLEAGFNL